MHYPKIQYNILLITTISIQPAQFIQHPYQKPNKMTDKKYQLNQSKADLKPDDNKLDGKYYLLEQKPDLMECLFCCFCEGANQYTISETDPNFNVASKKGSIKEESDCLVRALCVCNRPFQARLKLFGQEVAVAERPCSCWLECMPCAENQVVVKNKSGRVLGIIRVGCWCWTGNYFSCADTKIQVLSGENEEILYTIQGSYCQKSIFFPFCRCCYCPNIEYTIFDSLNLKVGRIYNIYNGCISELFSRTDKFGIQFPSKADQEKKILLTFATMYLDYLRYETPYFCGGMR